MFENKLTHNGIRYSRYIASWKRMGGKIYRGGLFERWLREKEQLNEEEISDILHMAECGKLELENSAKMFMEDNNGTTLEEWRIANSGGQFEDCQGVNWNWIKKVWNQVTEKYR